jgi:hypothetical protein
MVLMAIAEEPGLRQLLRAESQLVNHFTSPEEEADSYRVPEDSTDRVMKSVDELEELKSEQGESAGKAVQQGARVPSESTEAEEKDGKAGTHGVPGIGTGVASDLMDRWRGAIAAFASFLWNPRPIAMRPAWALMLLLGAGIAWGLYGSAELSSETEPMAEATHMTTDVVAEGEESVWIRFVYIDPDAEEVSVAGDFTEWEPVDLTPELVGGQQVWTGMVQVPRGEQHYMFIRNGEEWVTDPFADIRRDDGFGNENAVLYL